MSRKLPEGERRRLGTQKTRDKFFGEVFDWKASMHCVKLAHAHLVNMGRKPPKLPKVKGPKEAQDAMEERGWKTVSEMLDSFLERIPPAMMRTGDIGIVDGDEGFESVVIFLGPRKVMGWLPADLTAIVEVSEDPEEEFVTRSGVVIYDTSLDVLNSAWRV